MQLYPETAWGVALRALCESTGQRVGSDKIGLTDRSENRTPIKSIKIQLTPTDINRQKCES